MRAVEHGVGFVWRNIKSDVYERAYGKGLRQVYNHSSDRAVVRLFAPMNLMTFCIGNEELSDTEITMRGRKQRGRSVYG